MNHIHKLLRATVSSAKRAASSVARWWTRRRWWQKTLLILASLLVVFTLVSYGVSRWYAARHADEPRVIGVSFIADYARSLGLNAEDTMDALIDDLGVRRFRLVSYWNKIESQQGSYDFSELDWQFQKAEAAGADISLALGLRQPRWPECHEPSWATDMPKEQWEPRLLAFIEAVVNRYKDSPSLVSYQLENEFSLDNFGHCSDFDNQRVARELALVKRLDPTRPVIISRSDNFPALVTTEPVPNVVGMSVYRKVWNTNFFEGYFTYPQPAWYYGALAGYQQLLTGKSSMLHEMQMEPWPANGQFVADASLAVQDKSFPVSEFDDRIRFAKNTGLRTIDLWGAEWWYWRMIEHDDPTFWNAAKKVW